MEITNRKAVLVVGPFTVYEGDINDIETMYWAEKDGRRISDYGHMESAIQSANDAYDQLLEEEED